MVIRILKTILGVVLVVVGLSIVVFVFGSSPSICNSSFIMDQNCSLDWEVGLSFIAEIVIGLLIIGVGGRTILRA